MRTSPNNPIWGYLYIAWIGLVCIILLILNFELVRMAVGSIPFLAGNARLAQMLQFFLPIVMIFLEFRLYDYLIDRADRSDDQRSVENGDAT